MRKARVCIVLSVVLGLESLAPAALAAKPEDPLGQAFENLQNFARRAEEPKPAPPPPPPPVAPEPPKTAAPKTQNGQTTPPWPPPRPRRVRDTLDLRDPIRVQMIAGSEILGDDEREFLEFVSEIVRGGGTVQVRTHVIISGYNDNRIYSRITEDGVHELTIDVGTFARVHNRDELAAVIARAIARDTPTVLGHRDDPRILRRLEEQIAFESLDKDSKRRLLADVSAIERVRGMGLRPWGLTDFDRREEPREAARDTLFELRLLAQKITVAYLQERENIRDLIRTSHEFTPGLRAIHRRAVMRDPIRLITQSAQEHARGLALTLGITAAALPALLVGRWIVSFFNAETADEIARWIYETLHSDTLAAIAHGAGDLIASAFGVCLSIMQTVLAVAYAGLTVAGHVLLNIAGLFLLAGALVTNLLATAAVFFYHYELEPFYDLILHPTWVGLTWAWAIATFLPVYIATHFLGPAVVAAFAWIGYAFGHFVWPVFWVLIAGFFLAGAGWIGHQIYKFFWGPFREAVLEGAFVTYGNLNRWRLLGAIDHALRQRPSSVSEFSVLLATATDLNHLAVRLHNPHQRYADIDRQDLGPLRYRYLVPRDFWPLAYDFLNVLRARAREGRVSALELKLILAELTGEKNGVGGITQGPEVVTRALESRRGRRVLAALYAAVRDAYPRTPRGLETYDTGRTLWQDLDDTGVGGSSAIGIARLAFEIGAVGREPTPARLEALSTFLFSRLQRYELFPEFGASVADNALDHVFDGLWSRADAGRVFKVLDQRRFQVQHGYNDYRPDDHWPEFPERLAKRRHRALARGEIGRAVAIATWEAEAPAQPSAWKFSTRLKRLFSSDVRRVSRDVTEMLFRRELNRHESVLSLNDWIDREILDRGGRVERLTPLLFTHMVHHPELIRDYDDVLGLLDRSYYWPTAEIGGGSFFNRVADKFREVWLNYGALDTELSALVNKRGESRSWRYQTNLVERLHRVIGERLTKLELRPKDYVGLKDFWRRLTDRGVTSETDRLMQELIELAPPAELPKLRKLAVEEHRVWEGELHARLAIANAVASSQYQRLVASPVGDAERRRWLEELITSLSASLPERGLAFARFLEDLSVRINSTYDEAKRISVAKADVSASVGDNNLSEVRKFFRQICDWPAPDQMNFMLTMRDEAEASPRLRAAFPLVGIERLRRMYEILPLGARVGVLDTFLTHGLLTEGPKLDEATEALAKHIVGGNRTEAQRVTLQVLTAFLYAIAKVGNRQMITTILSYLYALPTSATSSPVEVLKMVLELFGATGIKVGQFTYASQVLGEAGEILQSLQSRARVPDRIEIYEDVYDLLGVPLGTPLPFHVLELLGAASMKYAFMGQDRTNQMKTVVKVFRLDAMNNVDLQFDVLEHMSEYLIRNHGAMYGVFKIIITSARLAVKREGSMRNEIRRSRIARHRIYEDYSTDDVRVEVPREDLVNARMIIAQYAEGVSFNELPDEAKPLFAKLLLEMENDIIFAERRVIRFDPDRHAGNAQLHFHVGEGGEVRAGHKIGPIDFGQVLRMPREQRTRITKLFALAQIAAGAGVNQWLVNEVRTLLDLNENVARELAEHWPHHLNTARPTAVARYVSTLAALDASGFKITDTTFIDLVRGIIQLTPFERWAPEARAPSRTFEVRVREEIRGYLKLFTFDDAQLRKIHAFNRVQRLRRAVTGHAAEPIPTDLSDFDFEELISRGKSAVCDEALGA